MVKKPRIYQLLRQSGLINVREDALSLLREGRVIINGRPVYNPDFQVNPKKESILVDSKPLRFAEKKTYLMLHKPVGYITAKRSIQGKQPVMDLLKLDPELMNRLFPVGRLDIDTSGLLLITDDGKFARRLLRPKSKVEKEYDVVIAGTVSPEKIKSLEEGVVIPVNHMPYRTQPAKVTLFKHASCNTVMRIAIKEGKKHQVRLMVAAIGHRVLRLYRRRIGNLHLDVPEGKYRALTEAELSRFFSQKAPVKISPFNQNALNRHLLR